MADFDLVLRGRRVITRAGEVARCVAVRDGVVVAIEPYEARLDGEQSIDLADDEVLLPGLVDTHVHVNEPGRTDWEGFETATRAAAAGGVTTLLDMPLNSVPATTSPAALRAKIAAARGKTWVDVGFIGGVVPGNAASLGRLAREGVLAFKCFLVPSGVPEFEGVKTEDLHQAMPVIAELGRPLMVHAELPDVIEAATLDATAGD